VQKCRSGDTDCVAGVGTEKCSLISLSCNDMRKVCCERESDKEDNQEIHKRAAKYFPEDNSAKHKGNHSSNKNNVLKNNDNGKTRKSNKKDSLLKTEKNIKNRQLNKT
ncbi:unnamed protein product, partial [Meganyctiphanes norvegica]